jgi:hypothetical protein
LPSWPKLYKEVTYRGWFEEFQYPTVIKEAICIIEEIMRKIENPKQIIMWNDEPKIPRCYEICGKFIINTNQFIRKTIEYMVKYANENEQRIKNFLGNSVCALYGKLLN